MGVESGSLLLARKRPLGRLGFHRSSVAYASKVIRGSVYVPSAGEPLYVTLFTQGGRSCYEAGSCDVTLTGTHLWHPVNMLREPKGFLDDDKSVTYRRTGRGYELSSGSATATIGLHGLNQVRVAAGKRVLAEFLISPAIRLRRTRSHDENRLLGAVLGSGLVHHVRFGADVFRGNFWIPASLVEALLSKSRRDGLLQATCLPQTRATSGYS